MTKRWPTAHSPAECWPWVWRNTLAVHPFGKFSRDPKSPAVTAGTTYDFASLTKPIVTTTAIMSLAERGELDLDAPVVRFLPEWAKAAKSDPDPRGALESPSECYFCTIRDFRRTGTSTKMPKAALPS